MRDWLLNHGANFFCWLCVAAGLALAFGYQPVGDM